MFLFLTILKGLKIYRNKQNENFVRDKKMVLLCERVIFVLMSCGSLIEVLSYFFTGETTENLRISDACNALISCHQLFEFTKYIVDPKSRNALRYLTMYIQIGKKVSRVRRVFYFISSTVRLTLNNLWTWIWSEDQALPFF